MSFLVLGLPRSRTAWLAKFLTYGNHICGHEELRHCRSLDDVKAWFAQPDIGTAETAAAPFWRLFETVAQGVKIVVVRRPIEECFDSLMRLGGFEPSHLMRRLAELNCKLDQIEARCANVLSVRFADLDKQKTCKRVFEHCLPYKFDRYHWERWASVNVQCDMRALVRYAAAHKPQLDKLAGVARQIMLADLASRNPVEANGMTYQVEPFADWIRDSARLFDEHLVQVGEAPGDWRKKNLPLMQKLDEIGALQVTTARANGRMFGYLMTVIGPSLESEGGLVAANTTFYASPDAPGAGLGLQRFAMTALREKGVNDFQWQAGVRGDGARVATIFKRLGAVDAGQVYRLKLEN